MWYLIWFAVFHWFVEFSAFSSHPDSDADDSETFTFFWQADSPFSQWYSCRFVVDGTEYNCAEQFMMHQKARELEFGYDFSHPRVTLHAITGTHTLDWGVLDIQLLYHLRCVLMLTKYVQNFTSLPVPVCHTIFLDWKYHLADHVKLGCLFTLWEELQCLCISLDNVVYLATDLR